MKLVAKGSLVLITALAALGLSACKQNKQKVSKPEIKQSASYKSVSHSTKPHKKGTLSTNQISPKENASIITIYAAHKYGDEWQKVLHSAQDSTLNIGLESRTSTSSNYRGEGYIYQVSAGKESSKTCYTISGDNSNQTIYLYEGDKYLGLATVDNIVNYLNKINCDSEVKSLMNKVQIGSTTSASKDSNSNSKKSNIPGDAGLFITPPEIRGTWYDKDGNTYTIGEHAMSYNNIHLELHKQAPSFSDEEKLKLSKSGKYKDISATCMVNMFSFRCMMIAGWFQEDGAREMYTTHTEKGQKVLLEISSAGGLQEIMWPSEQLAKKYANAKFNDLKELGGIMN